MLEYLNIRKYKSLDYLFLSLVMYNFFFTLGPVILPKTLYNIAELFFFCIFFIAILKERKHFTFNRLDADIKVALFLFIVWSFWVVTYSLVTNFSVRLLMLYVVQPISFLIYITPFFMLVKMDEKRLQTLSKWLFINLLISIVAYFFLYDKIAVTSQADIEIEGNTSLYSYLNIAQYPSSCFLALSFVFIYASLSKKWKIYLLWIGLVLAVVAALLLGRRSSAAIPLLVLFAKMVYDFKHKPKMLLIVFALALTVYFGYDYFTEKFLSTFVIASDRAFENTRYWVEHDFYKDMKNFDYIFGRGSEGLAYSQEMGYRPIIETGYLNMILHGGIIYLALYLYLLLSAAWKGLHSKNNLLVAMAFFILVEVVCLYPGGHLSFSMTTMALWICVACCSNRKMRNTPSTIKL